MRKYLSFLRLLTTRILLEYPRFFFYTSALTALYETIMELHNVPRYAQHPALKLLW